MNADQLPNGVLGLTPYIGDVIMRIALFALAFAVLIALIWYLWRRFRRKKPLSVDASKVPTEPIDVMIRRQLNELLPASPFNEAAQRDYFFQLSWLLRLAVEHASGIPATDLT